MQQCVFSISFVLSLVAYPAIKGQYAIINVETGKALRPINASKKDGAPLIMYSPVNWKCMTWEFQNVGDEGYQLKNLFSSKTFKPKSSDNEGASLEQIPFEKGNERQIWIFEEVDENIYKIRKAGTNLYITPEDPNGATNSNVILKPYENSNLQHWRLKEQHPTM